MCCLFSVTATSLKQLRARERAYKRISAATSRVSEAISRLDDETALGARDRFREDLREGFRCALKIRSVGDCLLGARGRVRLAAGDQ
eukprot:2882542-Pleurochrysis_carterae.AAC.1